MRSVPTAAGRRSTLVAILALVVLVDLLLIVLLVLTVSSHGPSPSPSPSPPPAGATEPPASGPQGSDVPPSTTTASAPPATTPTAHPFYEGPIVYGTSYGGRDLRAYRLGTGPSVRAIIGGIHGGYEWNTVELVSQTLSYLLEHPDLVPPGVTLYVIPCANPDGYAAGRDLAARVNGNGVDLNRNWDYHWQRTATHGTRPVDAGSAPFSEPETAALRDFILERDVELAVFYHSAMGKIFSGAEVTRCATLELAQAMSEATGYPHAPEGVPGQVTTGDAIDWLSAQGIAAVEVELTDHEHIEWERNLRGVLTFLTWTIPGREGIAPPVPGGQECITYTVRSGDTLERLALEHGVSVEELMRANGLANPDYIWAGQLLCIPVEGGE